MALHSLFGTLCSGNDLEMLDRNSIGIEFVRKGMSRLAQLSLRMGIGCALTFEVTGPLRRAGIWARLL